MTIRGRYAPSPTGELHLGNLRTALVAWLGARATGGAFVMRVEDLDPPRVIPGAEARILEDLRWAGLDWDEGPDVGGAHAPYRQSERLGDYRDALDRLAAAGRLYACECTRAQLRGLASAPHGPNSEGPAYPGTCREKRLPIVLEPRPGERSYALRFRAAAEEVCFEDLIAGRVCQRVDLEIGDFPLRRADGLYSYQLAVVVDDAAMEITQVVRGADLLHSTARQILLQRALGLPAVAYAHVPLVLNEAGERIAKRDRGSAVRAMREAGADPRAVVGLLARSLGLAETERPLAPVDLLERFDWSRLARDAWRVG